MKFPIVFFLLALGAFAQGGIYHYTGATPDMRETAAFLAHVYLRGELVVPPHHPLRPEIEPAFVFVGGLKVPANYLGFVGRDQAVGLLIYGGDGLTANPAWQSKIVLFDRGAVTFAAMMAHVRLVGALGFIVADNVPRLLFRGTLGAPTEQTLFVGASVTRESGLLLRAQTGKLCSIGLAPPFTSPNVAP